MPGNYVSQSLFSGWFWVTVSQKRNSYYKAWKAKTKQKPLSWSATVAHTDLPSTSWLVLSGALCPPCLPNVGPTDQQPDTIPCLQIQRGCHNTEVAVSIALPRGSLSPVPLQYQIRLAFWISLHALSI